jgi:TolB-like protein/DNA-binding winged helix-turn-helix (wHTH) protein/Tfp pilus assembly protein PilF
METTTRSDTLVRFESFELNLRTRELFRNGSKLKISGHPIEVLAILLEHPGELVTRETLQKRIWPDNTFVDFEQILNNSIGKIRRALGDRAESPRFIETLPRLGYRFIAQVQNEAPAPEAENFTDGAAGSVEGVQTSVAPRKWIRVLAVSFPLILVSAAMTGYIIHRLHYRAIPVVHRIAVLPLVNTSANPQEEYFADGMTESLITALAQFKAWEVISRTSVMRYKGSNKSLPQIAGELSADRILEGTVQRSGGRVRVTAQLIDAARDVHLWSGSFEKDITDVLAMQSEIAQAIADRADLTLSPGERARLQSAHKVVPQAYDAFLTGRFLLDRQRYAEAANYFEKATIADPDFALAYAYLAEADGMVSFIHEVPAAERALRAGRRAMELDPNLAESHIVAGDAKFFRNWEWQSGEAEFRRAYEIDPNSESAAQHYGLCLQVLGRLDEAIAVYKSALRVDPFSRTIQLDLLGALVNAHRNEEALAQFKKAIEVAPDSQVAYGMLGHLYEDMKRDSEAAEAYMKADSLSTLTPEQLKALQHAVEVGGLHGYWRKRIEIREQRSKGAPIPPFGLAILCARAGENDRTMGLLEEAYRRRTPTLAWINGYTDFTPLYSDPRFVDLIRRMNFPPRPSSAEAAKQ